jgi:HPt (histidine-containing phosphotransfer) domain-containing protein
MDAYLSKPLTGGKLAELLGRHLASVAPAAADTAAAAGPAPVFDAGVLAALPMVADGSAPEFAHEMLALFEQLSTESLQAIESALEAGDGDALLRRLHTLKSSSAQVGVLELAALARQCEGELRAGRPARPEWVPALWACHARARQAWRLHAGAKARELSHGT